MARDQILSKGQYESLLSDVITEVVEIILEHNFPEDEWWFTVQETFGEHWYSEKFNTYTFASIGTHANVPIPADVNSYVAFQEGFDQAIEDLTHKTVLEDLNERTVEGNPELFKNVVLLHAAFNQLLTTKSIPTEELVKEFNQWYTRTRFTTDDVSEYPVFDTNVFSETHIEGETHIPIKNKELHIVLKTWLSEQYDISLKYDNFS